MGIGDRIRLARQRATMSQVALSEAIGVDQTTLSDWELGKGAGPRLGQGAQIADLTGCSLRWLATGIGPSGISTDEAAA